jgi:hypothetical protein
MFSQQYHVRSFPLKGSTDIKKDVIINLQDSIKRLKIAVKEGNDILVRVSERRSAHDKNHTSSRFESRIESRQEQGIEKQVAITCFEIAILFASWII